MSNKQQSNPRKQSLHLALRTTIGDVIYIGTKEDGLFKTTVMAVSDFEKHNSSDLRDTCNLCRLL
jgi:hypothetical protein